MGGKWLINELENNRYLRKYLEAASEISLMNSLNSRGLKLLSLLLYTNMNDPVSSLSNIVEIPKK